MAQENLQPKQEKQILSIKEIEFINSDLQEKYEELLHSSSLLESEKTKWKATFEEFEQFYNNAPCGYHTIDESGLILKMNNTELDWLGYKRNEVVNKMNVIDLISEKDTSLFYKYMPVLKENGHIDQVEVEYVRKNGSIMHMLASGRAIFDEKEHFKCVNITLWDISDRLKMEAEMLKASRHLHTIKERFEENKTLVQKLNDELQLVRKEQNDYYNDWQQNIVKPLKNIADICFTLLKAPTTGAELQPQLKQIQEIVKGISDFVTNFRLQQKVSSDNIKLDIAKFDLSSLLVNVVKRLEEDATKKRITVNCEIYEDVWITSDEELLSQVVGTLLSAVIKLAIPGTETPLRLIHKVNKYEVELEIHDVNFSREGLATYLDEYKDQVDDAKKWSEVTLDSDSIDSLLAKLGFELTVSPFNHKGSVVRLLIPVA